MASLRVLRCRNVSSLHPGTQTLRTSYYRPDGVYFYPFVLSADCLRNALSSTRVRTPARAIFLIFIPPRCSLSTIPTNPTRYVLDTIRVNRLLVLLSCTCVGFTSRCRERRTHPLRSTPPHCVKCGTHDKLRNAHRRFFFSYIPSCRPAAEGLPSHLGFEPPREYPLCLPLFLPVFASYNKHVP